jgi:hypothetical protein
VLHGERGGRGGHAFKNAEPLALAKPRLAERL